ncbi:MAG TPA: ribonucleoside-diphosphate reductase subunit alpha [Alphaproteobacteria bacterium]|nr:ribonucleoside-diphosphate reductase subunit alpha [Alphaproteobacteria bacterium]
MSYKYNIKIDNSRDDLITQFGKETLKDRYLMPDESFQDRFANVACAYADDEAHAQRIYDYMSKHWFMPSTPILSNGGTERGLPISCFLNETDDSLDGIAELWNENVFLAARGGGIGSYWGNVRSIGERVGEVGKSSGVIPFLKVMDSLTLAISQGSLRRGSGAVYLPIDHPEIEEFVEIRRPTGGDHNRKSLNIHHGVVITDDFMNAVEKGLDWDLKSPQTGKTLETIKARDLWIRLLTARVETGEPYLLFKDHANKNLAPFIKDKGLEVKTSNLCCEIMLPTGIDHLGKNRTAVCCLSSLNLEYYDKWKDDETIVEDILRFLDNVLETFIEKAPPSMANAVYSAMRERSVGLGVMGYHSFLQKNGIPFESVMAKVWNKKIFQHIKEKADEASVKLADEKGACLDAEDMLIKERFSNKMAIAPTASISIIAGNSSPGIEPLAANSFTQKTLSGSFNVQNKYLARVLAKYNKNDEDTWTSIVVNEGSVQHLDFLTQDEKDVFKTAFELDQRWIVEHAADRTPFICQGQSVNVFLPADVHKSVLHNVHFSAWKKGVKSLYYCRSKTIQRAQVVADGGKAGIKSTVSAYAERLPMAAAPAQAEYDECLSCQ